MGGWNYVILAISIGLLVFTVWQEYTRKNKKYLLIRLIAVCLAVISLACLMLPITINKIVTINRAEAVIETDGYNADSVSRFIQAGYNNIPVYTWNEYKLLDQPSFATLHVFGRGLSSDALQLLNNKHVVFHPSSIVEGIVSASWKHVLHTGEQFKVQGSYINTSAEKTTLLLSGLNTVLDSVTIQPTQSNFELSTVPKNVGKAVYTLAAVTNNKAIEEELVPVDIHQPDSLAVLVLAASPDFENRFLKTWLSQNAFSVTMRTAISKGKFDKAFLNTPSSDIDKITAPLLDKFDVLVTDASAFASLTKDEQSIVQSKVEAGLGMIIKTDTVLPSMFYAPLFPLYSTQLKEQKFAIQFAGESSLRALHGEQSIYIKSLPGTQTLVTDSAGQIVANSSLYGQGKILLTTINNTYSWVLAGNTNAYHHYWGTLIDNAARKKPNNINISFNQPFPRLNQQLLVKVETGGNGIPTAAIDGSNVYLQQNTDLPFVWQGSYWPTQTGWQTITVNNTSQDFYVYDTNDWRYVAAAKNMVATKRYVVQQKSFGNTDAIATNTEDVPVPKIYFLIVFLVCCTVLWLERKFNG